jgi:hypothetical protein
VWLDCHWQLDAERGKGLEQKGEELLGTHDDGHYLLWLGAQCKFYLNARKEGWETRKTPTYQVRTMHDATLPDILLRPAKKRSGR